ncbi:MAG TPA: ester cyclase [Ktedonobacteraceae bacterium]|nr:ester cyclase [Ktedonobacteraceae bacterium]
MSVEKNKALVRRFVDEILNQGNMALAPELVAEDYIELDPFPGQQQGRVGLIETITMVRTAFPDLHWTIEEFVAEGQKVAGYGIWRGTHQGMFLGIPPTGRQVTVPCMVFDYCLDGKLKESRLLMNLMSLLQQLGIVSGMGL